MISLLTHFRRLSEVDLQRLRSSGQQRAARMGLNLLLLAGLWGLVLYLRALALPEPAGARYPPRAILGQWQAAITSRSTIEFTHAGVFRLMREGIIKRTAVYRFDERGNIILYALSAGPNHLSDDGGGGVLPVTMAPGFSAAPTPTW